MKKLQRNFTAPEQSKRLLELGVPADSADCYISNEKIFVLHNCTFQENFNNDLDMARSHLIDMPHYLPCWSFGRLIEIIDECALGENPNPNTGEYPSTKKVKNKLCISYIEYLVKSIERAKQLGTIDFSKLEE